MAWIPVHEIVSGMAARDGARIAVECGARRLTYAEVQRRAGVIAATLRECGVGRGTPVGVFAEDPIVTIPAVLGIWRAGAVFVPFSPALPAARLQATLAEVATPVSFVDARIAAGVRDAVHGTEHPMRLIEIDPDNARGDDHEESAAPAAWAPDDLAYIYFTSGSTGRPKGIAGRMKGIDHFLDWEAQALGLSSDVRVSQLAAPIFDAFLRDAFLPLSLGGTVCGLPDRDLLLDGRGLAAWIHHSHVAVIHCVPSLFRMLVNTALARDQFPSLRYILMGGEPLLGADVRRWTDVFGERITLVNLYGQSETTMAKFAHFVTAEDRARKVMPVGRPIPGAEAFVLDRRGLPCAPGAVGEIYIRTPYRSLGYYNRPDLTDEAFVRRPAVTGSGADAGADSGVDDLLYRTGDMARVSDSGLYEFLGRRDSQVKIRGVRTELAEVENPLRAHPAVRDVAVVDREDEAGDKFLCAYIVADQEVESDVIRDHAVRHLPACMVPSLFVRMEALPRTATGKVDRRALPAPAQALRVGPLQGPRTPIEELLAGVWARALGLERVDIHDDFFKLGGHSLLATTVMTRLRALLRVDVPLRQLFDTPTVAGMAAAIARSTASHDLAPIPRADRGAPLPLSFSQQRLWFLHQLAPGDTAYNLSAAVAIDGAFDRAASTRALNEIVRRHEALRTRFLEIDGQPRQTIEPHRSIATPTVDLTALAVDARDGAARRLAREEARRPFDLGRPPLIRWTLAITAPDRHVLLCALHHIVADGWAIGVLLREYAALYEAFRNDRPSPLPELAVQYPDVAVWERSHWEGDAFEPHLRYWAEQLRDLPEMRLPTDRPRRASRSGRGATEPVLVPRDTLQRLVALARQEGVTLFMLLTAAVSVLLQRHAGQSEAILGTPVANRTRPELEPLIAYCGNMLVLRVDGADNPPFRTLLARVRETTLDAYAHAEVPLERIVEAVAPQRDLARNALFQAVLTLQNAHAERLELPGLTVELLSYAEGTAKFDWLLVLEEREDGLAGYLEYDTDLFERATILAMWERFERLLDGLLDAPDTPIQDLPLLTDHDRLASAPAALDELNESLSL